jgi:enterochelin esterase-like enzyme
VSLTGGLFIWLLVALLAVTILGMIWWFPRVSGRKPLHILARTGMMLGCQMLVVVLALVVINAQYDFFSTWSDLVGDAGGEIPVSHSTQPDSAVVNHSGPVRAKVAMPSLLTVEPNSELGGLKVPTADGKLKAVEINGVQSGISQVGYVLLPPQYSEPAYRDHKFPVLVSLAGYPQDANILIKKLKLPQVIGSAEKKGTIPPTVVVMLRPTVQEPRDTECTDVPGGPQAETFFSADVPRAVMSSFRVDADPTDWAIEGDSTGGYCAVKIAMMHSDRFTAAICLAGYFNALHDITTGSLWGGSTAFEDENNLFWRLQHLPAPPVSVLVASSAEGEEDYSQTVDFIADARPPMKVASVILPHGGHNPIVWHKELVPAMTWLGEHFGVLPPVGPAIPTAPVTPLPKKGR